MQAGEEGERRGRRHRRGGRDRGPREGTPAEQQVDQAAAGNPQPGFPSMEQQQPIVTAVSESPVTAPVEVSAPAPQPAIAEQRIEQPVMRREEPKAQAFVAEAPAPVPVSAPAVVQAAIAPVEQPAPAATARPIAPQADPKELLSSSGLVMIETDPSRSKSYQLEEERVQLGRPRRERPKSSASEGLMQVETKN